MPQVLENAIGSTLTLPRGVFVTGLDRPQALTLVEGGLGSVITRRRLAPARGALEGSFKGRTYADAQAALDGLLAFLHAQPLKLRLHSSASRYLVVYTEGLADVDSRQGRLAQFRVPLVAPDPLWVATAASDGPRSVTGTSTYNVTNAGNAATPVTLTVTATSASRPKVENLTTGQEAELLLSVLTGNTWVLNGRLHSVERNGNAANDAAGNAFLVGGFELAPGVNEIRATRQAGSFNAKLDWVTRWY